MKTHTKNILPILAGFLIAGALLISVNSTASAVQNPQAGSTGVEATISSAPPSNPATITFPSNGATITDLPTRVSGLCTTGLLVKVFKNEVFAGSTVCANGSYSIEIDLFSGENEIVVRVYDALDQAGPDSQKITVTLPFTAVNTASRISLTSSFARRGANPGDTLTWPLALSGGNGPYALTVDWGDGKKQDVISREFAGTFNISHVYDSAGVYNIIVRATDKDGVSAFLQIVGVANGEISQPAASSTPNSGGQVLTETKIMWQPAAIAIPLAITSFWLGKKYGIHNLRRHIGRQ